MKDTNKAMLIGNVGMDVECHNNNVASFKLETIESWKDKASGESKTRLEYHRVVCFGKLADVAKSRVKKGDRVLVMGSIRTNSYKDKEGVDRRSTEIIASSVELFKTVDEVNNEHRGYENY